MTRKDFIIMETSSGSAMISGICMVFLLGASLFCPAAAVEKERTSVPAVNGSLMVGKTAVTFTHAVAYRFALQGAARGEEWKVVHVSDRPFDRAAVKAALKKTGTYSKDFDNQTIKARFFVPS